MWLTESQQSYYQVTAYRSCMSASSMGYTVMHSSYTNRRGVEKLLLMISTPSTVKESQPPSIRSVSSLVCLHNLQPSYSKLSRSSYFFQASLSSPSSLIVKLCSYCPCWKVVCRAKILLIDRMRRAVALNCSLNRHTEYVRQIE